MPILIVIVAGAMVYLATRKPKSATSSDSTASQSLTTNGNDPAADNAAQVSGIIAVASGAAVVGGEVGAMVDRALGGGQPGGEATSATAQIGGAAIGGAAALAAFGVIAWPVFAIVAGIAVVGYIFVMIGSDISRLAYGQAGARADYDKQWEDMRTKIVSSLRANPSYSGFTEKQIERIAIPTTDGYMRRLNLQAFRHWMNQPHGLFGAWGNDLDGNLKHAQWGHDRGYFLGEVSAFATLIEDKAVAMRSLDSNWVKLYCPENEIVATVRTVTTRTGSIGDKNTNESVP